MLPWRALLKARLREDWSLVFSKSEREEHRNFVNRDFRNIGAQEAITSASDDAGASSLTCSPRV
jgi:hypothetical protein